MTVYSYARIDQERPGISSDSYLNVNAAYAALRVKYKVEDERNDIFDSQNRSDRPEFDAL